MGESVSAFRFQLDAPIGPDWKNAELLRTAIVNCLAALFYDKDFSETVGLVAGELVENAIKYGDWSSDRSAFRFNAELANDKVSIGVSNPVGQNGKPDAVLKMVEWINGFDSPQEAYTARLLEISQLPRGAHISGLGLPRIAYEGNCHLDARVDNGVLFVTATANVGPELRREPTDTA